MERHRGGKILLAHAALSRGTPPGATGRFRSQKLVLLASHARPLTGATAAQEKASGMLTPALDILPASQLSFWKEEKRIPAHFVLYGGTALALRLGHRQSLDFDFFSSAPLDMENLLSVLPFVQGAEILQSGPNTLTLRIDRAGPGHSLIFRKPLFRAIGRTGCCRPCRYQNRVAR